MYLSRIKLNTARRDTQKALASPNLFHGAVESCFDYSQNRKLWRIDTLRGCAYLLLVSEELPDLTGLQRQFGYPDEPGESRDYHMLLDRIEKDSVWRFRLAANPIRAHSDSSGQRGHIKAEPNLCRLSYPSI